VLGLQADATMATKEALVLVLLWRSDRIEQRICLVLGFSLMGRLCITASIQFLVIYLLNTGSILVVHVYQKLSVSSIFFHLFECKFSKYSLMIHWISVIPVLIPPFYL
jgi:hypothetical protein